MKIRVFFAFLWFIYAAALACPAFAAQPAHPDGVVAWCFDGDTIKLKDRRIVRLAGIDAPETEHKDSPAQYYSRQSKLELMNLVRGKTVSLVFPGISGKDRHGRMVAEVLLPDGQSVNELMVARGAAFFYPHQDLGPEFQEKLRQAQADAISARAGMWEHMLDLPLAHDTYVGNKQSLRFFPASCPAAQRINPRNREHFGTLMDAFLAGYAPARICVFWPED